jgi:hypothetical protein
MEELKGIPRARLWLIYDGLRLEANHGMRLTGKAPTCYSIAKAELGLKGNKPKVLAQLRRMLWDAGVLNSTNDLQGVLE